MPASEDAKTVEKEEVEDEDGKSIGSPHAEKRKKKPNSATPKSRVKKEQVDSDLDEPPIARKSSNKAKKQDADSTNDKVQFVLHLTWASNTCLWLNLMCNWLKMQKDKNKRVEGKKMGAKEVVQSGRKKEKKVYDLPGQKRDAPEERDPLRIFYETLYKQMPNSDMAAFWMMESGLLSKEVAKKVYEKKLKMSQQQKLGSPMKAVITVKRTADSITVKKRTISSPVSTQKKKTPNSKVASKQSKKRKVDDDMSDYGSDDDFVLAGRKVKKQRAA
ncbi:hypothetical protein RJ640_020847 [Escallonia rubra]|uniref:Uncharacterized protein n=1 Tax=Escallonia rubra TaxID=112253 RepID=A0AA88U4H6_9ASTE|nr:hypothetical protein RJ640_020849 [Escallonia rubra]KAK2986685.1 hypothetical protein RJ640_020847 [Escallonia rubra]